MKMTLFKIDSFRIIIALYLIFPLSAVPQIITYPIPSNESKFESCQLQINGEPVDIYVCRVSKYPINQWWKGYQRPIDQTERQWRYKNNNQTTC
jgi:hypothetical protein